MRVKPRRRRSAAGASGGATVGASAGGPAGVAGAAPGTADPGTVVLHRLNRAEYDNTVQALLGTTRTPADAFPPDGASGGFDNNADVLGVSPLLLEAYLSAAHKVSALAVGDPSTGASTETYRAAPDSTQTEHVEGLPLGTRVRVTNAHNGRSVDVRINDPRPYGGHKRIIDLSEAAARLLQMIDAGVVPVTVEVLR